MFFTKSVVDVFTIFFFFFHKSLWVSSKSPRRLSIKVDVTKGDVPKPTSSSNLFGQISTTLYIPLELSTSRRVGPIDFPTSFMR